MANFGRYATQPRRPRRRAPASTSESAPVKHIRGNKFYKLSRSMNFKLRRIAEFQKFKHQSRSLLRCSEGTVYFPMARSSVKTSAVQISMCLSQNGRVLFPGYTSSLSCRGAVFHLPKRLFISNARPSPPPPRSLTIFTSDHRASNRLSPWKANFENYSRRIGRLRDGTIPYPVSPLSRRCRITDPTSCE